MSVVEQPPFDAVRAVSIGWLGVRLSGRQLTELDISQSPLPQREPAEPYALQICRTLERYLDGGEWPRDFPLSPSGTPFQQAVWAAMRRIPPGQTRTYGELAAELGSSPRAVGGACRANPIALLIPCHRVVAKQGDGGFAGHSTGSWPAIKRRLLEIEGRQV